MSDEEKKQNNAENTEKVTEAQDTVVNDIADEDATVVQSLDDIAAEEAPLAKDAPLQQPAKKVAKIPLAPGNDLLATAAPILTVIAELKRPHSNIDLAKLRQNLTIEIKAFDLKAKNNGIAESKAVLARYILCAVIDEFVLDTPWGANSNWSDHSLLNTFHQDSAGGAKFFAILEKIQQEPVTNIDLLELIYTCLCLGFVGKYRITQGGQDQLQQIKARVYQQIEQYRDKNDDVAPQTTILNPKVVNKVKRVPVLRLVIIFVAVITLFFVVYKIILGNESSSVMQNLRNIVIEDTSLPTDGSRVAKS